MAYNFKRLRKSKGWTQARAAELSGVDPSYIGQIETAQITFGTQAQMKWAEIFSVDISEFLATTYPLIDGQAVGGEVYSVPFDAPNIPSDELEVVQAFRELSEEKRKVVLATIRALKE